MTEEKLISVLELGENKNMIMINGKTYINKCAKL